LLESAYLACLQHELRQASFRSEAQVELPVVYRGIKLDLGYRMDLLVEDLVVVEIKSVEGISPVHQAQVISYLKLSGKSIGLLINFNVVHLKDGIKRFVNGSGWKEEQNLSPQRALKYTKGSPFPRFPLWTFVSFVVAAFSCVCRPALGRPLAGCV
jgi:GxxExxY protein